MYWIVCRVAPAVLLSALLPLLATQAQAQGCDLLLRDGVFNTFNSGASRYGYDKWHQAWCSATLKQTSSGSSTGASLDLVVEQIPIGLSYNDAKSFQEMYQSKFCSNSGGTQIDFSQESAFLKTADPSLMAAYVQCRAVETKGLETQFVVSPNQKVFTITMRYNKPFELVQKPLVKSLSFVPAAKVTCQGTIKPPMKLDADSNSLQCERLTSDQVSVLINTSVGGFTRDLAAVQAPPSDEEKVLAALPSGTILGWAAKKALPKGWRICDGEAGTPDLTDRSPVGTKDGSKVGEKFGEETHSHNGSGTARQDITKHGWSGCCNFESNGPSTYNHSHPVDIATDSRSNRAPSTRIVFIMKL